jgi:ADP-ribosyl-[dinitrogen reductase] hydrolase
MLAGAYYGMESIPKRWLRKMDRNLTNEISVLTKRLFELSSLNNCQLRC